MLQYSWRVQATYLIIIWPTYWCQSTLLLISFAICVCIHYQVLPALREKQDAELMLRELVKRWKDYKRMLRWLSIFFHYLSRYYIPRRSLPTLNDVGLTCFDNLVCFLPILIFNKNSSYHCCVVKTYFCFFVGNRFIRS